MSPPFISPQLKLLFAKLKQDYLTVHVLVPVALFAGFFYFILPEREIDQPLGILAPQAPMLTPPSVRISFPYRQYDVTPIADYELTARVLDKASYHWGRESGIAPIDLLLGWKEMSNTATLRYFSFHLSGRWYTWHASTLPLPEDDINSDLDNNHLIPATSAIEHQLESTRIGQIIHIQGFLVSVNGKDGYVWRSSLHIGSTGGPLSCKLIYVTKVDVVR